MTKDKTYRFIERCLYNYPSNVNRQTNLKARLKTLMSVRGHNYEAHTANGTSDPVNETVNKRLETERKIKHLDSYIQPVKKLYECLKRDRRKTNQMLSILKLKYFRQDKAHEIQKKLHISSSTYWRRTRELVMTAKEYFNDDEKCPTTPLSDNRK